MKYKKDTETLRVVSTVEIRTVPNPVKKWGFYGVLVAPNKTKGWTVEESREAIENQTDKQVPVRFDHNARNRKYVWANKLKIIKS